MHYSESDFATPWKQEPIYFLLDASGQILLTEPFTSGLVVNREGALVFPVSYNGKAGGLSV